MEVFFADREAGGGGTHVVGNGVCITAHESKRIF
jgi:hypothetical protein